MGKGGVDLGRRCGRDVPGETRFMASSRRNPVGVAGGVVVDDPTWRLRRGRRKSRKPECCCVCHCCEKVAAPEHCRVGLGSVNGIHHGCGWKGGHPSTGSSVRPVSGGLRLPAASSGPHGDAGRVDSRFALVCQQAGFRLEKGLYPEEVDVGMTQARQHELAA